MKVGDGPSGALSSPTGHVPTEPSVGVSVTSGGSTLWSPDTIESERWSQESELGCACARHSVRSHSGVMSHRVAQHGRILELSGDEASSSSTGESSCRRPCHPCESGASSPRVGQGTSRGRGAVHGWSPRRSSPS